MSRTIEPPSLPQNFATRTLSQLPHIPPLLEKKSRVTPQPLETFCLRRWVCQYPIRSRSEEDILIKLSVVLLFVYLTYLPVYLLY